MWTVSKVCCMGILIWISVIDLRSRKLPVYLLASLNLLVIAGQLYQFADGRGDLVLVIGGAGIGILFFLISRITEEGIGYGDSWMILILGIYLGVWDLLEVLAGTCFLLALASVVCLTVKRMSGKCSLPFVPFLAAGYFLRLWVI